MKINLYLNNLACLLIILLPPLLITGPFLPDLSIVIIDLIFIYFLIKNRDFKILNNKLFIILIIFTIYISIRSIFTQDIFFSLKSSFSYLRFPILIFATYFFLIENKNLIKNFSKVFLITISILFLDIIFQYIFEFNILGFRNDNLDKLNSFFGDEGVLGSYLIRLMPLFLSCYLFLYKDKHKAFLTLVLFLFGIMIFLSGSRSAVALFILFFLIFFLILRDYRKYISILLIIIFSLLFSIISYENIFQKNLNYNKIKPDDFKTTIGYRVYYNLYDPFLRIFNNFENESRSFVIFTKVHQSHYITAYNMFKENKLFGVGNKMYRKLCSDKEYYVNEFSCTTHPHNFYFQILAENGIIGILFPILFFFYLTFILIKEFYERNFKKHKNLNDYSVFLFLGIFLNLWPLIPSGQFFNNWLSILIYLPLGFILFFKKIHE